MHSTPDAQRRWTNPESRLGRAAAAIRHLTAGEAGEEDILAAELHYQGVWDTYQQGEIRTVLDRGRTGTPARDGNDGRSR